MRTRTATVSESQLALVEAALDQVEIAKAALAETRRAGADHGTRQRAHADLRAAYVLADARLREVTTTLKQGGHRAYLEWSRWRSRLSRLDTERQVHLFDESDDASIRPLGSVQAIDTGMSGPAIGELQHGESRPPGTPARYGLDMEAVMFGRPSGSARDDLAPTVAEVIVLEPGASEPRSAA